MHRVFVLIASALVSSVALSGCAIPAGVSIASMIFDGVSLASTGKSVKDHAISVAADEDCSMWRVLVGRPMCVPATGSIVAFEPGYPLQEAARSRDGQPSLTEKDIAIAAGPSIPASVIDRSSPIRTAEVSTPSFASPFTSVAAVTSADDGTPEREPALAIQVASAADRPSGMGEPVERSLTIYRMVPVQMAALNSQDRPQAPLRDVETALLTNAKSVLVERPGPPATATEPIRVGSVIQPDSSPGQIPDREPSGWAEAMATASPTAGLSSAPPVRQEAPDEVKRILAAKAVGPYALSTGDARRKMDVGVKVGSKRPAGLVAGFNAALPAGKGQPKAEADSIADSTGVYLVFGTFANSSKATVASRNFADFSTHVVHDGRKGRSLYRVVAGPYAVHNAHSVREAAAQSGAPHVWLLTL
jgi:hypothetical protein